MPWPNCDICGEQAMGVASSTLGAVSFSYCRTCLLEGAEVPSMIAFTIASCGGKEHVKEYVLNMIEPSLRRARLTKEEFDRMVQECAESL